MGRFTSYHLSDGDHQQWDIKRQENIQANCKGVEEHDPDANRIGTFGSDYGIEQGPEGRKKDRNLCPVEVPNVFVTIDGIIAMGYLPGIIPPILADIRETGERSVRSDEIEIIGGIEDDPSLPDHGLDNIVGCIDTSRLHLRDPYGQMIGLQNPGQHFGVAATCAPGGFQVHGN